MNKNMELPKKLENKIRCNNPRCITSTEKYVTHIFYLVNEEKKEYKCRYCDEIVKIVED